MKTIQEQIEVMTHFMNGGEVEFYSDFNKRWESSSTPQWDWRHTDYRIKEYQYPMWFKSIENNAIVEFTSLTSGEVISGDLGWISEGSLSNHFTRHTDREVWEQIEKPKEQKKTVTIEKWLIGKYNDANYLWVVEGTAEHFKDIEPDIYTKVKLLETYEVEI